MKEKLTQDRLKELLDYDPDTGVFINKIDRGTKIKAGSLAGWIDKTTGYRRINIKDKQYYAHRLAFLWMDGYLPENNIDHKDRNRLNNKWSNIREASQSCNLRNSNISKNNKSGITGVHWGSRENRWIVQICIPKNIYVGSFDNLLDSAKARWEAEVKYNFPNCNTTSSAYVYLKENGVL